VVSNQYHPEKNCHILCSDDLLCPVNNHVSF
jgi:hypothetical protein